MKKIFLALALSPLAYSTTYDIDSAHSTVGFEVVHLGITKVPGKFTSFKGSLNYDEKAKTISALDIEVQSASIDTGNTDRDKHLKSADFFDVVKYPTITFKLDKPAKVSGGSIPGQLTMHGTTKTIPVKITLGGVTTAMGGKAAFDGTTKIDRTNFGISWNKEIDGAEKPGMMAKATNKAKDLMVSNDVSISISVEANKKK